MAQPKEKASIESLAEIAVGSGYAFGILIELQLAGQPIAPLSRHSGAAAAPEDIAWDGEAGRVTINPDVATNPCSTWNTVGGLRVA